MVENEERGEKRKERVMKKWKEEGKEREVTNMKENGKEGEGENVKKGGEEKEKQKGYRRMGNRWGGRMER